MQSEGHVVSIVTLNVTDANFAAVAGAAESVLEQRLPTMQGFVQGSVLANEGNTRIVIMTEWVSRESWAKAEWDQVIAKTVTNLYEITASYDLQFLFPLLSVKAASI